MTERLYETDSYLATCTARVVAVTEAGIVLDRTVFYARGGGQPGDSGVFETAQGAIAIADTVKGEGDDVLHAPADPAGPVRLVSGDTVTARIDWDRRHRHMRMHTCLHLLCALVAAPVTGGNLNAERGRLDFDLPESTIDKDALGARLNALIAADTPTALEWITDAELDANPALVKTLSVQPPRGAGRVRLLNIPGVDLQPCGGTHVARTGEIGAVRIGKVEKKSRLNRRIHVEFADG